MRRVLHGRPQERIQDRHEVRIGGSIVSNSHEVIHDDLSPNTAANLRRLCDSLHRDLVHPDQTRKSFGLSRSLYGSNTCSTHRD